MTASLTIFKYYSPLFPSFLNFGTGMSFFFRIFTPYFGSSPARRTTSNVTD